MAKTHDLPPELLIRLVEVLRLAGMPEGRISSLKPRSPWSYSTGVAIAIQSEIERLDPALADLLIAEAGKAQPESLLVAAEQAALVVAGKSDTLENYTPAAAAVLQAHRPGEAAALRQARIDAVAAELDRRVEESVSSRPERAQARREAELAARQAGQRQLEAQLQAGGRLGG